MDPWAQCPTELVADLYEFTMAASYWEEKMSGEATFSLFIRKYPANRAYFVASGIETLLEIISTFQFREESLEYLREMGIFSPGFLQYLKNFRFSGTVRALPEGRIFFADEPVVEVTAPIIEAQLLETIVINTIQLETLVAGKAARCMHAAQGRSLVDFSLRRTHGIEAGLKVARASYLAGFAGTSNVLAGKIYAIPVYGTMAHSYVCSFSHEMDAFLAYARTFPDHTVLLVDTYDTLRGLEKALEVARQLRSQGYTLRGVRLDSGDLAAFSQFARRLFLQEGFGEIGIMVSGNLDEYRLDELLKSGAEIDIAGVGTHLGVSADAPYLDIAYKLVEYDGRPIIKLSPGKKTWAGRKQIFRFHDSRNMMTEDILGLSSDHYRGATPLLEERIKDGRMLRPLETLATVRRRFQQEWAALPVRCRDIAAPDSYPVRISPALTDLQQRVVAEKEKEEIGR
jgi:nicotinate phosphoribosyltransferase